MKKNKKIISIFTFFLGVIITLGAVTLMDAVDVSFNNAGTKITSGNVQGAIEELDKRFKNNNTITCTTPAVPNLNNNLIPVTIADDGTVIYANTNTKWYDYCNKEWANSVMLINNPSKTYKVNDTILESDIKAYFVWIPKYKYKLWNVGTTNPSKGLHSIDIIFDTTNTTDVEGVSCVTPMTANNSGNCNNGEYMTHPAFISMNVNGFWVGKFEVTGTINAITVKPGITSLRNQTIKTSFESMYNYSRENDSHMMKNTEWGAVAYLTHSKYGSNHEPNINNNSSYITGSSALGSTDQHGYPGATGNGSAYNSPYNTEVGYLASTTGNITGVYDMSGGTHEFMASYRANTYGASKFTASTISVYDSKYFDVYPSDSGQTSYQYRILGDATGEMGPFLAKKQSDNGTRNINRWYSNLSVFLMSNYPWVYRGGANGSGIIGGMFSFEQATGGATDNFSSRLVLSP